MLSEIVLPSKLEYISSEAFSGCEKLESISIPKTVISIHGNAFYKSGLKKATFLNVSNWKKFESYTYNGYSSTLTKVDSNDLSDEIKAAQLLTETYSYMNDNSHGLATYWFIKG